MEVFKDIEGYEGLYRISNLGNVYSIRNNRMIKGRFNTYKYVVVTLSKKGITKEFLVHRLVAQAFMPNPENKPTVNHIDGDKSNNNIKNLEWATYSEQSKHLYKIGLKSKPYQELNPMFKKYGKLHHKSKPVIQYDLDGNFIKKWENSYEVQREYGYRQSNISECCLGKRKTAYKYKWKYEE